MSERKSKGASREGRSTLRSKNVTVAGHRTSVRLEPEMWSALNDIVDIEGLSLHLICTELDRRKDEGTSLTAALRVFVMAYHQSAATEEGHKLAGHGYGIPFAGTPFQEEKDKTSPPLSEPDHRRRREAASAVPPGAG